MYSWEITDVLHRFDYNIDFKIYLHILNTSPQVCRVEYDYETGYYDMYDNENNHWRFTVYCAQ